jgi:hypothetical protein
LAKSSAIRLEGGAEDALVVGGAVADLGDEVVDLAFDGADFYLRVDEADGLISTWGSTRRVGRMICSMTTPAALVSSYQ